MLASFDGVQVRYDPVHKMNLAYIHHRPRGDGFFPDTCTAQDVGQGDLKGNTIPIYSNWWKYIEKINTAAAYNYARSIGLMWINILYDKETPYSTARAESVLCGGNFISWDLETDTHVRVLSYPANMNTDTLTDDWHNKPYLFWKACAVNGDGRVIKVGNALDVYIPIIRNTELWIRKSKVTIFQKDYYTFSDGDAYLNGKLFYPTGAVK